MKQEIGYKEESILFKLIEGENSFCLKDSNTEIKTNNINRHGVPIFRIRHDLLEMIPELKLIIKDHITKNNKAFKVSKYIDSKCWLSMNGQSTAGYGMIFITVTIDGYKFAVTSESHVASYLSLVGPNPDGLLVRHKCDIPPCCNPDHLELGTHKDNSNDAAKRHEYSKPTNNRGAWRLNIKLICLIRYLYKYKIIGNTLMSQIFDISMDTIWNVVNYNSYPDVDETWFYKMIQKRNRRWTDDQINSMYESGLTAKHLSRILDVSHTTVLELLAEKRRELGEVSEYRYYTQEEDKKIIAAHKKWGGLKKLAIELNVTVDSLYQRVKKLRKKGLIVDYKSADKYYLRKKDE